MGDDVVAEGEEIRAVGGAGSVDQGEGVEARNADRAEREAFGKAGALDEPGGGKFDLIGCGPVGDPGFGNRESLRDVSEGRSGDDWILEERAGGSGVGCRVCGIDQHALGGADLADGFVDFERGGGCVGTEVFAEVGVGEVGSCVWIEAEADLRDDVAVATG